MARDDDEDYLNEVSGKAVVGSGPFMQPSGMGKTKLQLTKTRLIERTKFIVSESYSELLLTDIQGGAILTRGNPLFIALGFMLFGIMGPLVAIASPVLLVIPVLVLLGGIILYFIFKRRFLVIHAHMYGMNVFVKGDPSRFRDFLDDVLAQAEKVKSAKGGGGSSSAGTSSGEREPSEKSSKGSSSPAYTGDNKPAKASKNKDVVVCPGCGAEYDMPAGGPGKRFRCAECKEVIQT